MKLTIPSSIIKVDLSQYVTGRPQRKKSICDAAYYVVSLLTPPFLNSLDYQYMRGFKPLSSKDLNRMTRNRFNEVKTILLDSNLTENGSILLSDNTSIAGIKHTGYKLNQWALEKTDFVEVEIDEKYDTRKEKLKNEWELDMKCFDDRYIHIKEAMDQSQITIDAAAAENYLKELKKRVLSKVVKENKTQVKKYFKKSHKVIENIEKEEFNYSVSKSNHRVNSVFTSMKRELRYFLKTNGESMVEVDITTSHPFTLATILTEKFFTETKSGYNLYSIFPQYYKSFKYSCDSMEYQYFLKIFAGYMVIESNVINDNYISYLTYQGNVLYNIKYPLLDTFISYMCGRFWRRRGIQKYRSLNFKNDIYESIGKNIGMTREKVKDQFQLYINFSDKNRRVNVELIKHMERKFKDVSKLIQFMSNINHLKSPFSYLIQRCESYLFLRHGCLELSKNNIPYITIHDSVLCQKEKRYEVQYLITDSIIKQTGLTPGIKFKELEDPFPLLDEAAAKIVESINYKKNDKIIINEVLNKY
ncbi:hypothetical protein N9Y86_03785 [Flavobacteriaceae bacterium]|nr:hypothetical protein [Flavobacteriaceae bacterium]MDA9184117.1 hypothetical protein [Flavobacteriaceae bacterium]MDA9330764.1 hypothetical protein [Flavobacteriaceae bacterium]MDA9984834.1 hypothetical protein [Flavobacteriaceae bacterium]MDB2673005.1 hypothetical protein [Flavobacteriaceae bacterium]